MTEPQTIQTVESADKGTSKASMIFLKNIGTCTFNSYTVCQRPSMHTTNAASLAFPPTNSPTPNSTLNLVPRSFFGHMCGISCLMMRQSRLRCSARLTSSSGTRLFPLDGGEDEGGLGAEAVVVADDVGVGVFADLLDGG